MHMQMQPSPSNGAAARQPHMTKHRSVPACNRGVTCSQQALDHICVAKRARQRQQRICCARQRLPRLQAPSALQQGSHSAPVAIADCVNPPIPQVSSLWAVGMGSSCVRNDQRCVAAAPAGVAAVPVTLAGSRHAARRPQLTCKSRPHTLAVGFGAMLAPQWLHAAHLLAFRSLSNNTRKRLYKQAQHSS